MRALVIGASGFLGSTICEHLQEEGWDLVAMSRSGTATHGTAMRGDVTLPELGLESHELERLRSSVTHVISCFGSVDWTASPRTAVDLHHAGTEQVLRFARRCRRLERLVHVSSILALGRARGTVGNHDLHVGQSFRTWYEYGKYLAERSAREAADLPRCSVRLGPLLGVAGGGPPDPRHGLLAVLPLVLRGYPIHLARGGAFPCYVGEVNAAAAVVCQALTSEEPQEPTWTWYDPGRPSLADVLIQLCEPWGRLPRIVDAQILNSAFALTARRVGIPRGLTSYTEPWVQIDEDVLNQLPDCPSVCRPDYINETGAAIREAIGHRRGGKAALEAQHHAG